MKRVIGFFVITILMLGCAAADANGQGNQQEQSGVQQKRVSQEEFKSFLAEHKDVQIVDVRTAGEYSQGAIENAQNIDFNGANFKSEMEKLDKTKPVAIYCQAGGRSSKALEIMKTMGFGTIIELEGGYGNWK